MKKFTRRTVLLGAGASAGVAASRYFSNEDIPHGRWFPPRGEADTELVLNDASALNPTEVAKHLVMKEAPGEKLTVALRAELKEAKAAGRPFVVSAARHSMGAQSLAENGSAVTLDQNWLEPDTASRTYRVAAGMRWSQVITDLDRIGFSPKVMQSNNDFGVASTFCVNAHGWPVPWSGFGSTVRSVRLMLPDGEVTTCSRDENTDLFALTMGGYGLTGAITDLDVEMVPNVRLTPKYELIPAKSLGIKLIAALKDDPKIQMAYGRLDVTINSFFDEALLITYTPNEDQESLPPASGSGFLSRASGHIFRNQLESDHGKSLRWFFEKKVGPRLAPERVTRNSLINEPVVTLDDGDPVRTDILHEYFVSPFRFAGFVEACQDVIPTSYQQLLNVTLRYVDTDKDSVLAYAREPSIAAVMLFSQEMSVRGEIDMARMTQALIERTLELGGSYYLPYRLHATDKQFQRAYGRAPDFVSRKRALDPDLVFRNTFWDRYLAKL